MRFCRFIDQNSIKGHHERRPGLSDISFRTVKRRGTGVLFETISCQDRYTKGGGTFLTKRGTTWKDKEKKTGGLSNFFSKTSKVMGQGKNMSCIIFRVIKRECHHPHVETAFSPSFASSFSTPTAESGVATACRMAFS